MTQRSRFPNRTKLNTERAKSLFSFIRDKYTNRTDRSINDVISSVLNAFSGFFQNLGQPVTKNRPIQSTDNRDPSRVNATFKQIEEDLRVAYEESKALRENTAETYNYSKSRSKSLLSKIERTTSKVVSLKLQSDKFGNEFIYAGDNFVDRSKIDDSFPSKISGLDVPVGQNMVTLKRSDSLNRSVNIVDISVSSSDPDGQYEGAYYGLAGAARPEGGVFLFEEVQTKLLEVDKVYSKTGSSESEKYQVGDNDVRLKRRDASDEQLQIQRRRMVDGDPRTFWEIEKSFPTSEELQKYVEDEASGEVVPLYSPEQIFDIVKKDHDKEDFVVELTFKFQTSFVMNWINLIPHIFGDGNWLEIMNLETSVDGVDYESIDGLFDGKYENTLTSESNAELNKTEIAATLSPSKFSYIGTGLWAFAPRQAQFVRFTIKQKVPTVTPYNLYTMQLKNVGKTTTTVGRKSGWF